MRFSKFTPEFAAAGGLNACGGEGEADTRSETREAQRVGAIAAVDQDDVGDVAQRPQRHAVVPAIDVDGSRAAAAEVHAVASVQADDRAHPARAGRYGVGSMPGVDAARATEPIVIWSASSYATIEFHPAAIGGDDVQPLANIDHARSAGAERDVVRIVQSGDRPDIGSADLDRVRSLRDVDAVDELRVSDRDRVSAFVAEDRTDAGKLAVDRDGIVAAAQFQHIDLRLAAERYGIVARAHVDEVGEAGARCLERVGSVAGEECLEGCAIQEQRVVAAFEPDLPIGLDADGDLIDAPSADHRSDAGEDERDCAAAGEVRRSGVAKPQIFDEACRPGIGVNVGDIDRDRAFAAEAEHADVPASAGQVDVDRGRRSQVIGPQEERAEPSSVPFIKIAVDLEARKAVERERQIACDCRH